MAEKTIATVIKEIKEVAQRKADSDIFKAFGFDREELTLKDGRLKISMETFRSKAPHIMIDISFIKSFATASEMLVTIKQMQKTEELKAWVKEARTKL
jgi:hypothetical protein